MSKAFPMPSSVLAINRWHVAASRYFGTWPDALLASGLSRKLGERRTRSWNAEKVIEAIRAWHKSGRLLSKVHCEDRPLYAAAATYCGNWRTAVRAAGLGEVRQQWTPQRVVCKLQDWWRQRSSFRGIYKEEQLLYAAAIRIFGSWGAAIQAAGLKPTSENHDNTVVTRAVRSQVGGDCNHETLNQERAQYMSREAVIRRIVQREMQEDRLDEADVIREEPVLHCRACELFGAWSTALQYAGVSTNRHPAPKEYCRKYVISRIRYLCLNAYSLRAHDVRCHDRRLVDAAHRHFGGWKKALRRAGVNLKRANMKYKVRELNREEIIRALRQRHNAGRSLSWNRVCFENRALATAAKNAFHGWRRALLAAGVATESEKTVRRRKWDKRRVIEAILRLQEQGKPLHGKGLYGKNDALVCAARRYFGSWDNALQAAALQQPPDRGETPDQAKSAGTSSPQGETTDKIST